VKRQRSWLDEEPGVVAALRETARLLSRALRRPILTLLLSAVLAAALVGLLILKDQQYAPTLLLRVVEADRDPSMQPRLKRHLREYVVGAVFTSAPLYQLIEKHGLYPGLARKNPQAALESFREDIDVDVYQNYFVEERTAHDSPRSARVAISYRSANRDVALAVTRDLGRVLVEHEGRYRREQAARAARIAERTLDRARRDLVQRQASIADAWQRVGADDRRAEVEVIALSGSLPSMEARVSEAERRKATLDLGSSLEQRKIGMLFEEVDAGGVASSEGLDTRELLLLGATFFILGLPLVGLGVGGFARSPRTAEDARAAGHDALGQPLSDAANPQGVS
jgi:hypothetical protein